MDNPQSGTLWTIGDEHWLLCKYRWSECQEYKYFLAGLGAHRGHARACPMCDHTSVLPALAALAYNDTGILLPDRAALFVGGVWMDEAQRIGMLTQYVWRHSRTYVLIELLTGENLGRPSLELSLATSGFNRVHKDIVLTNNPR